MLRFLSTEGSKWRLFAQSHDVRNHFERDRDRIIHSIAFRRLQYKTQVFINYEGDHYRTRLTHSLEVAQIARSIGRRLEVNEDLCELIALAHDLGHPPFGHNGEYALGDAAHMHGGFDHNAQTLRIVCMLENRHIPFDGLNLTVDSIDGIMKHNGPINLEQYKLKKGYNAADTIEKIANLYNIDLTKYASIEAQIAAISDDIAYCNHDIDDGIRAGFISLDELSSISEIKAIMQDLPLDNDRATPAFTRHLTSCMIDDVIESTFANAINNKIASPHDVTNCKKPLVCMSGRMNNLVQRLKQLLFARIYKHTKVSDIGKKSNLIVTDLFTHFFEDITKLPKSWQKRLDFELPAVVVLDYIAGMTDRYAIQQYDEIIGNKNNLHDNL